MHYLCRLTAQPWRWYPRLNPTIKCCLSMNLIYLHALEGIPISAAFHSQQDRMGFRWILRRQTSAWCLCPLWWHWRPSCVEARMEKVPWLSNTYYFTRFIVWWSSMRYRLLKPFKWQLCSHVKAEITLTHTMCEMFSVQLSYSEPLA